MTLKLPFLKSDPAQQDHQYLEDLATAYWYSEVLFGALELELFARLDDGDCSLDTLAEATRCRPHELERLMTALERLALVHCYKGVWTNSQLSRCYLVPGRPEYIGDLLLYRRYMRPSWYKLASAVAQKGVSFDQSITYDSDYASRNHFYVQALDALARRKAIEIVELLNCLNWPKSVIDIGGGAGAMSRAILKIRAGTQATLIELPEVIQVARQLYPKERDWIGIHTIESDFRIHRFDAYQQFGLVLLSNCLHAYGWSEAKVLLKKAIGLMAPGGLLLIHDYFPDRQRCHPHKGALYDLAMMLNTFNGVCHKASKVSHFLEDNGLPTVSQKDLKTDSSLILAGDRPECLDGIHKNNMWIHRARVIGFNRAVRVRTNQIETAPWVRMKCRCGCIHSGTNHQCPPNGNNHQRTREMLDSYTWGLMVEGVPPGKAFHRQLLALEKLAFTEGFHKALAFGAGPCPVCHPCPQATSCRFPELARPSLEGSGVDVYTTARKVGLDIKVLPEKGLYVKYIGLILME